MIRERGIRQRTEILIEPSNRKRYIQDLLIQDGLVGIHENSKFAYCAISLTATPEELKPVLRHRQDLLMQALGKAGITAYDPGSAPFSPDAGLTIGPEEIYRVDKGKVVGARFFVMHDILPSTGVGVELETARTYNKIPVVLHDNAIRTSRMQPNRVIHLAYNNFETQMDDFVKVFQFLQEFEPGMGLQDGIPTLLGFQGDKKVVNLEQEVYQRFPHLKYVFNGDMPIVVMKSTNGNIVQDNA